MSSGFLQIPDIDAQRGQVGVLPAIDIGSLAARRLIASLGNGLRELGLIGDRHRRGPLAPMR
jgi:hypothetical protein